MAVSNSIFLQLSILKNVVKSSCSVKNVLIRSTNCLNNACSYSTAPNPAESLASENAESPPPKKMNKAMIAYLERAKAHDEFIKREKDDYVIGKRHLANIMGENPETFTQEDVDKAIEYLLPSGLFDKAARPIMKPPEEIFPPRKAAEFDSTGRPFHTMFYTTAPNYYKMLYDMVEEMEKLNALEDEMTSKGTQPKDKMDLASTQWVSHVDLEKLLLEKVEEKNYEYFVSTATRLSEHPWAIESKDLIMKFRSERKVLTQSFEIPALQYDAEGRPYITVNDCMRKSSRGAVTVIGRGTGTITVNGQPLSDYFKDAQHREQVKLSKSV